MKQVAQRPSDGRVSVEQVPTPALRPGWLLVRNRYSLISAGTERSKLDLGRKNLVAKARARPDLVRKTIDKARVEGIGSTVAVVRDRLAGLDPLGYSSAGVVQAIGPGVEGVAPGDPVACAGSGWANHASLVVVPKNLVARVPDGVDLAAAAYSTVGAIALHAVHQADARLGERVGVIGLGLVGQITVRLLVAAGCEVVGIDLDARAVSMAKTGGASVAVLDPSDDRVAQLDSSIPGSLDAVIICAATSSNDPIDRACWLLRSRGRIVVVGDVPIQADRSVMYEKELELRLSRSYGPGRYSADYEEHGRDLPAEYVRWTEQRNLQAFVSLIASGRVCPGELTTHTFPVDAAADAYELIHAGGDPRPMGVLLEYPAEESEAPIPAAGPVPAHAASGSPRIGLIGVGAFARSILVPGLARAGATLAAVASEGGLSAADAAARFGFQRAVTPNQLLEDERIDAVVIATRHSSHAELAVSALRAGKAVFVEKPLALSEAELGLVVEALPSGRFLMVGFNRRFAPFVQLVSELFRSPDPGLMTIRVNAGRLPDDHWLHDPLIGGGRLLGEACHFIDLLMHCNGSRLESVYALASAHAHRPLECSDDFTVSLRFADGGSGTLHYTGAGDTRMGKERIEAFADGQSVVIDDFRRLERFHANRRSQTKGRQDKGHARELERFVRACRGQDPVPEAESYLASTSATLAAVESLLSGQPVVLT